jgi:hypothetical protein
MTARELANRVLAARRPDWMTSDPTTAIVATEQLGPEDEQAVRREVAAAGYRGKEQEEMVREVSTLVVHLVEGLADTLPAAGGD